MVICKFFSGSTGEAIDLGVLGEVDPGVIDLTGGKARVRGGGARVMGGRRAFSEPSWAAAECRVRV